MNLPHYLEHRDACGEHWEDYAARSIVLRGQLSTLVVLDVLHRVNDLETGCRGPPPQVCGRMAVVRALVIVDLDCDPGLDVLVRDFRKVFFESFDFLELGPDANSLPLFFLLCLAT